MEFQIHLNHGGNCRQTSEFCAEHLGGRIVMPMAETFFAHRFAMFRDRFGASWMLVHGRSRTERQAWQPQIAMSQPPQRETAAPRPPHALFCLLLMMGMLACGRAPSPADRGPPVDTARWTATLADSLVQLGREDQQGREELGRAAAEQDTATLFAALRADSARTRWLRSTVERSGWPMRATVGDSASKSAWLILQHSPDTAWQGEMLPVLERLGRAGELPLPDVALLTDRILVQRGEPQLYGSQFHMVGGRLEASPIADVAGVDILRSGMGLPPMSEYVRLLGDAMKLPVVWPPAP